MLIACCSLKGSPGVTTLVMALAAQWPRNAHAHRLVVECDPSGGDVAIRYGLAPSPGLVSLAAAARRTHDPAVAWQHTQSLPGGARVVLAPTSGGHARAAMRNLTTAQGGRLLDDAARAPDAVVLVDCGRLDPGSPAESLAYRADALVLVTGTHGDELAHVAARLGNLAKASHRPALLLTGRGYPTGEIENALGVPALGRLVHAPATAAAWAGRRPPVRRSTQLARSVAAVARTLAATPVRKNPPAALGSADAHGGVPPQVLANTSPSPQDQPALPSTPNRYDGPTDPTGKESHS